MVIRVYTLLTRTLTSLQTLYGSGQLKRSPPRSPHKLGYPALRPERDEMLTSRLTLVDLVRRS
jgi:hypothetical protein